MYYHADPWFWYYLRTGVGIINSGYLNPFCDFLCVWLFLLEKINTHNLFNFALNIYKHTSMFNSGINNMVIRIEYCFNTWLIRLIGFIKISFLQTMKTASLFIHIVYNVVMTQEKSPCFKKTGEDVNKGKFYQSRREMLRLMKSSSDNCLQWLTYVYGSLRLEMF